MRHGLPFFLAHPEPLGVETLRLEPLFHPFLRTDLEDRIHDHVAHLHDRLVLKFTFHQRRAAASVDHEVPLGGIILAIHQEVLVITSNVRFSDAIVVIAGNPAQDSAGVVIHHLHTAHRVRRGPLLPLHDQGQSSDVFRHLQAEVDDVQHLNLIARNDDRVDRLADRPDVGVGLDEVMLPRTERPFAVSRLDRAHPDSDERPAADAGVVQHVSVRGGDHPLGRLNLLRNPDPRPKSRASLPWHNVVWKLATVQRVQNDTNGPVIDQCDDSRKRDQSIGVFAKVNASSLEVFLFEKAVVVPYLEPVIIWLDLMLRDSVSLVLASRAFDQDFLDLLGEISWHTDEVAQLSSGDVVTFENILTVVDVFPARRVWIEVPRVDAATCRVDGFNHGQGLAFRRLN